jgi:hypothetical protein
MHKELAVSPESHAEDMRREALIAFLGAGMSPAPTTALLVSALANARRAVDALQDHGEPIDFWLEGEMRCRGIRENAATLAAMEIREMRENVAEEYARRYPDRASSLRAILNFLSTSRCGGGLPPRA